MVRQGVHHPSLLFGHTESHSLRLEVWVGLTDVIGDEFLEVWFLTGFDIPFLGIGLHVNHASDPSLSGVVRREFPATFHLLGSQCSECSIVFLVDLIQLSLKS